MMLMRDIPKLREDPERLFQLAHRAADNLRHSLRVRIELEIKKEGDIPKARELAERLDVSLAQLYRAVPGLIKRLKRGHVYIPEMLHLPEKSAMTSKENLNWGHDG
jgi:hypothetical protein